MIRILIAGLLAAAVALAPNPSAQQTQPELEYVRGTAQGVWQMPKARDRGHMAGDLMTFNVRLFQVRVKLAPPKLIGGQWMGRMEGVLLPARGAHVSNRPIGEVRGRYVVGPQGNGYFEAGFLPIQSEPDVAPRRFGRMWGLFHNGTGDKISGPGSFNGRWVVARPAQ